MHCVTLLTVGFVAENKKLRGLGIGAPDGPISLDDFRSLQRSNKVLFFRIFDHDLDFQCPYNPKFCQMFTNCFCPMFSHVGA